MSQQLTSLERESELKAIVIKYNLVKFDLSKITYRFSNDLFENKSEHIKRQRNSIALIIRHCKINSSVVLEALLLFQSKQRVPN